MILKIFTCLYISLILLTTGINSAFAENLANKTLSISIVADLPILQWYKKYILFAYHQLNYRVNFIELPSGRGIAEANKGNIDALAIRISDIEPSIPDFIRVPVVLAQGELVLYCQVALPCNKEVVDDPKVTIGIIAGVSNAMLFMQDKRASLYQITNALSLKGMFEDQRLDYILTLDTPEFGNYTAMEQD